MSAFVSLCVGVFVGVCVCVCVCAHSCCQALHLRGVSCRVWWCTVVVCPSLCLCCVYEDWREPSTINSHHSHGQVLEIPPPGAPLIPLPWLCHFGLPESCNSQIQLWRHSQSHTHTHLAENKSITPRGRCLPACPSHALSHPPIPGLITCLATPIGN